MPSTTEAKNVAYAYIRNQANAGISWGNNNYPAGSLPEWFGGPTTGLALDIADASLGAPGALNAAATAAALRSFALAFSRIRLTRIVILYKINSGEDFVNESYTTQYDGTAVAYTAYPTGDYASGVGLPGLAANNNVNYNNFASSCNNLWAAYYNNCRASVGVSLQNIVCHTSCHDNCHCARGRR